MVGGWQVAGVRGGAPHSGVRDEDCVAQPGAELAEQCVARAVGLADNTVHCVEGVPADLQGARWGVWVLLCSVNAGTQTGLEGAYDALLCSAAQ